MSGAKIGDTINIRKPPLYEGRTGKDMQIEDHRQRSVPLQLNTQFGVDVEFTSKDMTLSLDDFSENHIKPAAATIANKIDRDGLELYKKVFNSVGSPGQTPDNLKQYLQAGAKLDDEGTPRDGLRSVVINPDAQVEIVDSLKGLFQSSTQIKKQYEQGNMGMAAGFKWSMDQNVISHEVGQLGGTGLVRGANQKGPTLQTDGWSGSVRNLLREGDIFTIEGVYAVNPQSRQNTGKLRQFVVTGAVSSDGGGRAGVGIYPSLENQGAFRTVTQLPADNARIQVLGTRGQLSPTNLAYHRDAFVLGSADLLLPKGVHEAERVSDKQLGLSIRMIQDYDMKTDVFGCRMDVLYGWAVLYPELACRIQG